jgi:hypothetical protein
MKKKIIIILLSIILPASVSYAGPFLVSDPYPTTGSQPTHFSIVEGANPEVLSPAETVSGQKRLHYDLAGITTGTHNYTVKAVIIDPVWGRLDSSSVPFAFQKPGPAPAPGNIALSPN